MFNFFAIYCKSNVVINEHLQEHKTKRIGIFCVCILVKKNQLEEIEYAQ